MWDGKVLRTDRRKVATRRAGGMQAQKMAFIGSGHVGRTLATGLAKHGHQVMLASRDPSNETVQQWLDEIGTQGRAGTYPEAAEWADWVFICVPGTAVDATVSAIGAAALEGKIVVDVTNATTLVDQDHSTLTWGIDDSLALHIQRAAPGAHVVKAFNTTGVRMMIDPEVPCAPPTMPICGNDAGAKAKVSEMLEDVGWEPIDLGTIHSAAMIEAMILPWLQYGHLTGIWTHCYKFVHR
jgi:predicted dinucleotide-binding enzyme